MTGQHEPDPNNRFETWADGMTPSGQQPPPSGWPDASDTQPPTWPPAVDSTSDGSSAAEPPAWTPSGSTPDPPRPAGSGQSFPTYPYSSSSAPHADPQQDEAFAAFRGYQAGTQGFPHQGLQPHHAYQGPYSRGHHPYGAGPRLNAPFAVPSLVLGIISVFCGGITGPIGLGLGIAALKQIESDARALGGRGLAIAGIATSAFGTFILLMFILGIISG